MQNIKISKKSTSASKCIAYMFLYINIRLYISGIYAPTFIRNELII